MDLDSRLYAIDVIFHGNNKLMCTLNLRTPRPYFTTETALIVRSLTDLLFPSCDSSPSRTTEMLSKATYNDGILGTLSFDTANSGHQQRGSL